jgi:hypothetical protein
MRLLGGLALLFSIPLGLAACDAANGSDDATRTDADATFEILLTDAPLDDAVSADVTIERVELRTGDDRAILLSDVEHRFDLLRLQNGVTRELATERLEGAETYTQLRIVVGEDATLTMDDGTVYELRTPSGSTSGIKLNLPEIDVDVPQERVSITVDFDLEESFVTLGPEDDPHGFLFKPVLKIASVTINGVDVPADQIPPSDNDGD